MDSSVRNVHFGSSVVIDIVLADNYHEMTVSGNYRYENILFLSLLYRYSQLHFISAPLFLALPFAARPTGALIYQKMFSSHFVVVFAAFLLMIIHTWMALLFHTTSS